MFYIDDLKFYAKNNEELEELLSTVKIFRNGIGMKVCLDKCPKPAFIRARLTLMRQIKLYESTSIRELDQKDLQVLRNRWRDKIQHVKMKDKITKECYWRGRAVLQSESNVKNKLEAIIMLATPVGSHL